MAAREKMFNVRFSAQEMATLETVASCLGLNSANLVRMLLKEKARALGLDQETRAAE